MVVRIIHIKAIFIFVVGIILVQHSGLNCLFAEDAVSIGDDIKIIVRENSFVKLSRVFLGDVSEIQASGILKEALEKVVLGSSPKPDNIKSFDRTRISSVVHHQRYLPENITIVGPDRIYVKRLGQTISHEDIRPVIDQQLARRFKNQEYQLKNFSVRGLETYAQGKTEFRADSDEMVDENGKLSGFLDVIIDGKKEDRVSVSGSVALYERILYTAKSYKKGQSIIKGTVYHEKKNMFELRDNVIRTFEEVEGKILRSGIRKGDYLKAGLFSDPPMIQKGDIVQLISKNENLLIVTSALSKEDGFENKLIRVENLSSGKLVRGIVKGKSIVEVVY